MSLPPLLQQHIEALREMGHKIEVLEDGTKICIIFKEYAIANSHWNRTTTDLMIIAQPAYPNAKLDMFYVPPGMRLADGRVPKAGESEEVHGGKNWQRFSWHVNNWNPAHDSLITYLNVVDARLSRKE